MQKGFNDKATGDASSVVFVLYSKSSEPVCSRGKPSEIGPTVPIEWHSPRSVLKALLAA